VRIGVVTFPGTLDDGDAARAVRLAGGTPVALWHASDDVGGVDAVVLPGGFSYGDYLRCGAIAALAPVMSAVVEASGVGYAVQATPSTLAGLREGVEVLLHTSLVVREDSMTLFGFADRDEREVFEVLQSVSGVGPRLALAMLATLAPDALRRAVACGDVAALQRVPGIGKKGAQRLVLELGAKLGPERGGRADPGESATVSGDVVEALVGLGWSERDAAAAVAEAGGDSPEAGLPELLRASLRVLGARR